MIHRWPVILNASSTPACLSLDVPQTEKKINLPAWHADQKLPDTISEQYEASPWYTLVHQAFCEVQRERQCFCLRTSSPHYTPRHAILSFGTSQVSGEAIDRESILDVPTGEKSHSACPPTQVAHSSVTGSTSGHVRPAYPKSVALVPSLGPGPVGRDQLEREAGAQGRPSKLPAFSNPAV